MSRASSRCFPLPEINQLAIDELSLSDHEKANVNANAKRIDEWLAVHSNSAADWHPAEQHALGHLIPLVLCGEQSAQLVFNQEINRLFEQDNQKNLPMIKSLLEVEEDEFRHDTALQAVLNSLPAIKNQVNIQRQAQLFYAKLGRGESRCQHFIKIATLDSCVTQVMSEFEHCLLGAKHPFAQLCGLIKKDEAKHVYIAKHYAQALGATPDMFKQEQRSVSRLLHQLLATQAEHFSYLGVDLIRIFNTLEDKWQ